MLLFLHFIHHLLSKRKRLKSHFWQISNTIIYANYATYCYKYFNFIWRSTKTNVIKNHSIPKVFAKMPISAWPWCASRYAQNLCVCCVCTTTNLLYKIFSLNIMFFNWNTKINNSLLSLLCWQVFWDF